MIVNNPRNTPESVCHWFAWGSALDFRSLDFASFDGPVAQRGIGIIAPFDLALERELWRLVPVEVSLHLARTPYEPVPVSMEMAQLVGNGTHLAAATRDVLAIEPEVVAYLCSSGSFVNGVAAERAQRKVICEAGAPGAGAPPRGGGPGGGGGGVERRTR